MHTQQRQLTEQERIDQATMRIDNPNVAIVGSGFIQHPPQRPFERPLQVQPPTLSHLDHPDEYRNVPGLQPGVVSTAAAPAAGPPPGYHPHAAGRGGGGGGQGYSNGAPGGGRGAGAGGRGYAPGGGGRGRGAAPSAQRPVYRQVPAELLRAPAPPPRPGAYANGGAATPAAAAARPPPPRPVAVAPPPAPVAAAAAVPSSPRNEDGSKLSKAQKQRLRKKLREAK